MSSALSFTMVAKVEEVLETLEELMDKESLKRMHEAEEEYQKGDCVIVE